MTPNYPMAVFTIFLDVIISLITGVLPMLPYFSDPAGDFKSGLAFLPVLDPVTTNSQLLSLSLFLIFSGIWMIISLATFVVLIQEPTHVVRFWWTVYPQLHLLALHVPAATFAFCLSALTWFSHFAPGIGFIMVLDVLLFPFYTLMTCLLFFVDTNAVINPNPIYSEWLYGTGFFYPLINACSTIFSILCYHTAWLYAMLFSGCSIVIQLIFSIYLFYKMPFLLPLSGQVVMTKSLMSIVSDVMGVGVILSAQSIGKWCIITTPLCFFVIFFIVYLMSGYRRRSMHLFLRQFDDSVRDFSLEAIRMTLSSIHSENEFQWVIRESFISGNANVLSQKFVQFCLQAFPDSQWLLSMVAFLFGDQIRLFTEFFFI
jgi:hypothetical protein